MKTQVSLGGRQVDVGRGASRSRPLVALTILSISTLLSMSVWFSATFIVAQLQARWVLDPGQTSALTMAVQLGFVLGAVVSAASGLADKVPNRILMCCGALGASAANAALLIAPGLEVALILRLLTGLFLASVYPPAMKEVAAWFRNGRGKALGVMIGALTLGSALPHGINMFGQAQWEIVLAVTSVLTFTGGLMVFLIRGNGPYTVMRRPFRFAAAFASLRNRDVVLANLGYMGHMWELYAMWAAIGAFLSSLPAIGSQNLASGLALLCIGIGALGCLVGGVLGDRLGRAKAALISMVFSGGSALLLGIFYPAMPTVLIVVVCAFWGFWVIADSAQFSALVTERVDPDYVGAALSLQLALGYLTTLATLWLVPALVHQYSWSIALSALAIGPIIGVWAMKLAIKQDQKTSLFDTATT